MRDPLEKSKDKSKWPLKKVNLTAEEEERLVGVENEHSTCEVFWINLSLRW